MSRETLRWEIVDIEAPEVECDSVAYSFKVEPYRATHKDVHTSWR